MDKCPEKLEPRETRVVETEEMTIFNPSPGMIPEPKEPALPKKGIGEAIYDQDADLTVYLQARLSMDDYHEAMEKINILIDLNMYALDMVHTDATTRAQEQQDNKEPAKEQ